jgi:hypothetical protein
MTKHELIKRLKNVPDDCQIKIRGEDYQSIAEDVEIISDALAIIWGK